MPVILNPELLKVAFELVENCESAESREKAINNVGTLLVCCAYYSMNEKTLTEVTALSPECATIYNLHCKFMDKAKTSKDKRRVSDILAAYANEEIWGDFNV